MKRDSLVPLCEICANVEGYNDEETGETTVARRFERDKAMLRDLGMDLEYKYDPEMGEWGYTLPAGQPNLNSIDLTPEEVSLIVALAAHANKMDGPLSCNLASACQKLLTQGASAEINTELLGSHFFLMPSKETTHDFSVNLQRITMASEERQRMRFKYYSVGRDSLEVRTVEPYGLKFFRGFWYLAARCVEAGEIRVFRLDRIKNDAVILDENAKAQYSVPHDFSVDDYVGLGPWELARAQPVKVTIELDERATFLVEQTEPGLTLKRHPDGGALAEVMVASPSGFYRWLVTLGTHARITSPRKIIDGYLEFIERIRKAWPEEPSESIRGSSS